ncbi:MULTISPECIES: low temperature requirement protein A [Micromonospora]|uniref:Low temperature requirement protein A n=1 Tax=Micromonospora solifontis TaxID=2487138 RepID=A0ABX9WR09_9ACTN|nr:MULTISPECIES: low temperature requirement protein A [Micromonospora]NES12883.1 low temperature requirement protein A [Micromonospora sp. PPF5-17B]NES34799.1 low temperature requirement protein A [Micromonospora solifontis]NES54808.1 low temperature requirement protein A [Micromonospora sp. PPF5-6]RNM01697.1 low temperature requirement protein A [Micromonospora solifontis]
MAAERGAALLRRRSSSARTTFLELFFDLVFVFALTRVSQRLLDDLPATGWALVGATGRTLLLFLALWLIWMITTWVTSRYEPQRGVIQLVVIGSMFGSLMLGVALPKALEERAVPFAVAYVAVMLGRPLIVAAALGGHPRRLVPLRLAAWAAVSAVPWLAGALGPDPLRVPLWVLALTVDYVGLFTGWPVPRFGAAPARGWLITGEHLAERYQQIFLIALGESILVIGITYSGEDFSGRGAGAFTVSFVTIALLWRIYFHRAGDLLAVALRVARSPGRLGASAAVTHLFIVLGVLTAAVGYELVIAHPYGRGELGWLLFVVGGPALFLAARARFEYEIFARVSVSRVLGVLLLVLLAPLLARGAPVLALSGVAGVLALVALLDALRSRGRPAEQPASPLGRERRPGDVE